LERNPLDAGVVVGTKTHYLRIILQGVVDDPSIVGIHRLELDRPARDSDSIGDLTDSLAEFVVAHGPPVPDVDLDTVGIPVLGLKNPVQEKL
jgi:hypothetical protein